MKVRPLTYVACGLLLASLPASAAEPPKYKVRFDDVWKTGDVVTRDSTETEGTSWVEKQEGGTVVREQKGYATTRYRVVEKCLAAEGGKATGRLLYFVRWGVEGQGPQGPFKDEGLTGLHVELSGSGTTRAWRVVTPGKELSELTRAWLEMRFGSRAPEGGDAAISPADPVAPGSAWSPDVAAFVKALGAALSIDVEKSTLKVTFQEVQPTKSGEFGKFVLEGALKTRGLPGQQGPMAWREGGTLVEKGVMLRRLAEGAFDTEKAISISLTGVADAGSGNVVVYEQRFSGQMAVGTGGEMPPVPAAPTPEPAQAPPK